MHVIKREIFNYYIYVRKNKKNREKERKRERERLASTFMDLIVKKIIITHNLGNTS